MSLEKFLKSFCCGLLIWITVAATPVYGQLLTIQDLILYSNNLLQDGSKDKPAVSCLRIDGRCAFKIAFPKSELSQRTNEIQFRLNEIKQAYLQEEEADLKVYWQKIENNTNIYISINENPIRLLTITTQDAVVQGLTIERKAELVVNKLEAKLLQAKSQRRPDYLIRQVIISLLLLLAIIFTNLLLDCLTNKPNQTERENNSDKARWQIPFIAYLKKIIRYPSLKIQRFFVIFLQFHFWLAGILIILGLFPLTRTLQVIALTLLRLPIRITIIAILIYLLTILIYKIINNINDSIVGNQFVLSPRANKRLELRVNTISQVTKGIITIFLTISGFFISLIAIGIDITPFLAGAGIIGLAFSFASQSFIKDALNGFLIIFEDQYAVGDIINLNDVGGMVEYINLRITKIRDTEGRSITIPNSKVEIVANLSSQWSRADLNIPLNYNADLSLAIAVITQVANQMSEDESWREFILEPPLILGVDNFSDRGIIIRLFIKTEPLKQWDVSREFRRRVQIALKEADIPIVAPQQQILIEQNSFYKS
ncbi:MAG: mechanosensitive ion channel family protein [Cyanobacteria bacterium J06621_8]